MSEKVSAWLEDLELGQYSTVFKENAIDWELLPELDQEILKDIGVSIAGHRMRILKAATALIVEQAAITPENTAKATIETAPSSLSEEGTAAWSRTPGELKPVTMLFADVVGSTNLTEKLDAEEAHDLLYRSTQLMCEAVEHNRGTVCRFMGDGIMAMFGAPIASERHALEACRAALDMQASIEKYARDLKIDHGSVIQIRVGLNSGEVVVLEVGDDPEKPEYDASGPTVPLAARMEQVADAGKILITEQTHALAGKLIEAVEQPAFRVKGFSQPMVAFELVGLRSATDPFEAASGRPIVGRRSELAQVRGLLDECRESDLGQIVLVRGEAGIGKSRLVTEISVIAHRSGYQCHKALVLDFGTGKGQEAVPSLIRSLMGISSGSGKHERMQALDRVINEEIVQSDQSVYLHDLLDLPQPLEHRTLYDAMDADTRSEGKRFTLQNMLSKLSVRNPKLIIVEDLHWADHITLRYLSSLAAVASECPVVIVMTSRIEGDPIDTTWRSGIGETPIVTWDLSPLRRADSAMLVSAFIDTSDRIAQRCIERAAGNPLFLEQLLLNIDKGGNEDVPDSIKSLVLARIDQLPKRDNRALRAASVLGQRFQLESLRFLIDDDDYECNDLINRQLIRPEGALFLFAHALIQEGAYASLLKPQRVEWHRRAAHWYAQTDLILHAEHLSQAEDDAAARAFLDAAEDQLERFRPEKSLQLVRLGLENATGHDRFDLTCMEGELLRILGTTPDSVKAYRRAIEMATDKMQLCRAQVGLAEGLDILAAHEELFEVIDQAEASAKSHNLKLELAQILRLRSSFYFFKGDADACLETSKAMLGYAREAGSLELEARALSGIGDAEYMRGCFRSADRYFSKCIEIARQKGFGRLIGPNLMMLGYMAHWRNEQQTRNEMYEESAELALMTHDLRNQLHVLTGGIWWAEMGEFDKSRDWLDRALTISKKLGSRILEGEVLYLHSLLEYMEGNLEQARELASESVEILEASESGMTFRGPTALAVCALTVEDDKQRRALLQRAEEVLAGGCVAHNYIDFYELAMRACLQASAWEDVERYARLLEEFTANEPLARCDLFIALGCALAAYGRGQRDGETILQLQRVYDEASASQLNFVLPELETALSSS
jgi:class 3 adenylate cyclase/tetratricopeptide (TPR) repeat protein